MQNGTQENLSQQRNGKRVKIFFNVDAFRQDSLMIPFLTKSNERRTIPQHSPSDGVSRVASRARSLRSLARFARAESIAFPRIPLDCLGFPRTPSDSFGFPRSPLDSLGFLRILRIPADPRIPADSLRFPRIPWDSVGFPRIPLDSRGLPWIPLSSLGFPRNSFGFPRIP